MYSSKFASKHRVFINTLQALCLAMILSCVSSAHADQIVTAYNLSGTPTIIQSFGQLNNSSTQMSMQRIESAGGKTYVSIANNNNGPGAVWIFGADGSIVQQITTSRLDIPSGMAVDTTGNVYVASSAHLGKLGTLSQSADILKFDSTGTVVGDFQPFGVDINEYLDVKINSSGSIIGSAWGGAGPNIARLDSSGNLLGSFDSVGPTRLETNLAVSSSNDVWVLSDANGPGAEKIEDFGATGTLKSSIPLAATDLYSGLRIDKSGNIWTYDNSTDLFEEWQSSGALEKTYSLGLTGVSDFTFTPDGDLLVIDNAPEPTSLAVLLPLTLATLCRRKRRATSAAEN